MNEFPRRLHSPLPELNDGCFAVIDPQCHSSVCNPTDTEHRPTVRPDRQALCHQQTCILRGVTDNNQTDGKGRFQILTGAGEEIRGATWSTVNRAGIRGAHEKPGLGELRKITLLNK